MCWLANQTIADRTAAGGMAVKCDCYRLIFNGAYALILGYDGPQPADVPAIDRFLKPFVPAETTAKVAAIEIEEDQPQELVGVQRFTGLGAWTSTR